MSKNKNNNKEYSVGYKKPPKEGQFKPGISGNPKGKKKQKSACAGEMIQNIASMLVNNKVDVVINGKKKKISALEAICANGLKKRISNGAMDTEKILQLMVSLADAANKFNNKGSENENSEY